MHTQTHTHIYIYINRYNTQLESTIYIILYYIIYILYYIYNIYIYVQSNSKYLCLRYILHYNLCPKEPPEMAPRLARLPPATPGGLSGGLRRFRLRSFRRFQRRLVGECQVGATLLHIYLLLDVYIIYIYIQYIYIIYMYIISS